MRSVRRFLIPAAVCLSGCASMSNTEKGMGLGGLTGAGLGAAVGSMTGNAGVGAAIGGAAGAIAGGLIGNDIDKEEQQELKGQLAVAQAAAARGPLHLTEIAGLAQSQVSDQIIINQIRTTGSQYHLTPTDIAWLKSQGVSDPVIVEMQNTSRRPVVAVPPRPVIVEHTAPVYVIERPFYGPYYGPPPGIGFSYTRIGRR